MPYPRPRYGLIDFENLTTLLNFNGTDDLRDSYRGWVKKALQEEVSQHEGKWTESIAMESRLFVEMTKERLGIKAKGRRVTAQNSSYELREPAAPYRGVFGVKNGLLRLENAYFWDEIQ